MFAPPAELSERMIAAINFQLNAPHGGQLDEMVAKCELLFLGPIIGSEAYTRERQRAREMYIAKDTAGLVAAFKFDVSSLLKRKDGATEYEVVEACVGHYLETVLAKEVKARSPEIKRAIAPLVRKHLVEKYGEREEKDGVCIGFGKSIVVYPDGHARLAARATF